MKCYVFFKLDYCFIGPRDPYNCMMARLGENKETKKSVKVGAVKVYDTNLIYSRVTYLQASDRPADIADLLAHELASVPRVGKKPTFF